MLHRGTRNELSRSIEVQIIYFNIRDYKVCIAFLSLDWGIPGDPVAVGRDVTKKSRSNRDQREFTPQPTS